MADSISSTQTKRIEELQYKEHLSRLKKERSQFDNGYRKEVASNERMMEQLRKDYEVKISTLKDELEQKINDLRNKHGVRIKDEMLRLDTELSELKQAHELKKNKLMVSQDEAIQKLEEKQANYQEIMERKLSKEKR